MGLTRHNPNTLIIVEGSAEQHAQITQAVMAGEAAQARSIMSEHIEATATLVRGFLGER